MRKVLFLCFLILTYYVAGTFRSVPLMTLCAAEASLGIVMLILPRCVRARFRLTIVKTDAEATKSLPHSCTFRVENRGVIPIGKFVVRMLCKGPYLSKGKIKIRGNIRGRAEAELHTTVTFPSCGIYSLQIDKVKIFDPCSIFHTRKKYLETEQIAVFPMEKALRMSLYVPVRERPDAYRRPFYRRGNAQEEIRQLREYQPGDSHRHIHWNQSARTDSLWVKEYEEESEIMVNLQLTNRTSLEASQSSSEAFYEILSALLLGLLRQADRILVFWQGNNGENRSEITNAETGRAMLKELYQLGPENLSGDETALLRESGWLTLSLDYNLHFYRDEILLYPFSAEEYEEQIAREYFAL